MNKINYQKKTEEIIESLNGRVPTLLLHSCCGPCSSYSIEFLSQFFSITVFYYNPNIYPDEEYLHRVQEQKAFIERFPAKHPVSFIEGDFDKDSFYAAIKGKESHGECSDRCEECFKLRLGKTAKLASEMQFDYFTTTLTISPMKNAELLNTIGENMASIYGSTWLHTDLKKKNGYKRSTELSKEYDMYRQDYCGCVFSYNERHGG